MTQSVTLRKPTAALNSRTASLEMKVDTSALGQNLKILFFSGSLEKQRAEFLQFLTEVTIRPYFGPRTRVRLGLSLRR